MSFFRAVLSVLALALSGGAQTLTPHQDPSLAFARHPTIYLVAAGPDSEKFNHQIRLLADGSNITASLGLVVVPDTPVALTMGWPSGLKVHMPDQRTRTAITSRFGRREINRELLAVLVDKQGLIKATSYSPMTAQQIKALLHRKNP